MDIKVAAYGWKEESWDGHYPDDLPGDWRLDYYANEFLAMLVPAAQWQGIDDDDLLEWMEQVSDDFCFYWELGENQAAAIARLQYLLKDDEFAAHWGGVVVEGASGLQPQTPFGAEAVAVLRLNRNEELREMRSLIEQAMAPAAAHLLVVVEASAMSSLRPAHDLAQLLGSS